jgi:single-strand DNA-binding protein
MNKVIVVGNLGADPTMRTTQGGQNVTNFSVATSEKWKDKQTNEMKEKTEWHKVVVWGAQAQACAQYLFKGSKVAVEGSLQTSKWTDNSNIERYTTEIKANKVEFLTPRNQQQGSPQGGYSAPYQPPPQQHQPGPQGPPMDDDIPF